MYSNKKFFLLIGLASLFIFNNAFSQTPVKYHKIRIDLKDKNPLLLFKFDLPMDHGKYVPGRYFENDFSEDEIATIHKAGYKTEIVISDVENYYSNPNRKSEFVNADYNGRNDLCRVKSNNVKTPVNYFDGSMGGYFTYEEMIIILEWMQNLYPNLISKLDTISNIKTHDGNVIHYLKVSDNPNVKEINEPQVLYTALHHAREPNSLSQMIFYLWYILENYNKDEEIKYLVDNTEMYFIPCVNPDGYIINEVNKPNGGGLWRKNGRKDNEGKLKGVDLNRNYGFEWGHDNNGSSNNVNSDTYRGTSAFSEPETQAVRELCVDNNFVMALNYHSYGDYLIHPWGYNDTPTSEDSIFKRMGYVMNAENAFKMGTGTETVGYTTNGDSDDYMYGEQFEKNKIYSYTPEVGYSFWPAPSDIDFLNKNCLQMNLSIPRLANGVIMHEIDGANKVLTSTNNEINIIFSNPGLKERNIQTEIVLIEPVNRVLKSAELMLTPGEKSEMSFNLDIDSTDLITGLNDIAVLIIKDYGSYRAIDTVVFSYFYGKTDLAFTDECVDFKNWTSNGNWGNSFTEYTTAPASFTDSPGIVYPNNTRNTLTLFEGLDLSKGKSPILQFRAKWNIEKDFDYASVYAFVPGKDTVRLCGNFTNLGAVDQLYNEPIYDGFQQSWIHEAISLQDFQGEDNVFINFEMVSDDNLEMDGIYIDDIDVIIYTDIQTNTNETETVEFSIVPNPTNGEITFTSKVDKIEIFDLRGNIVLRKEIFQNHTDISTLDNGMYIIRTFYKNNLISNAKLALVK